MTLCGLAQASVIINPRPKTEIDPEGASSFSGYFLTITITGGNITTNLGNGNVTVACQTATNFLLLETGAYLLLETGMRLMLEP